LGYQVCRAARMQKAHLREQVGPLIRGERLARTDSPRALTSKLTGLEERKNCLRRGICLGERGGTGLLQDLQLHEFHLLLGEVGV
jgi:hypothetical protein